MIELRQIGEQVWSRTVMLGGEAHVATYLVGGDGWALIDTGVKFPPGDPRSLSRSALARIPGFDDLDHIVLTHGHYDHVGGVAALAAEYPAAQIYLHPADRRMASSAIVQSEEMAAFAKAWNLPEKAASMEAHINERMTGVHPEYDLADGMRIDLGGGALIEVIALPGHTAGSVAFRLAAEDITFVGDAVQGWGSRTGSWPFYADPTSYRDSLKRLASYGPQRLAMAHGYHCGLPFNSAVLGASDVLAALELSVSVVDAIEREVLKGQPGRPALEMAREVVHALLDEIPARTEPTTGLPNHAGMALWAHGLRSSTTPHQ
ncbi:MBL fold metallo-hydrolase [Nocardioides daeguensis]|uniref:Metallo-beta-lactamase domain-containing protein n=1 Tax=Nocardioides daeguensis TaxID=908359 RepID=A0ABP6W5G8_9ACTN|nr:MBL fold metallo-hydrolase [Nocardioides daeguensis]MBV6729818.1 MBL fold metallo-hydrolase [Nocardioides daeguensis]MCR1775389.1 MBL fold metallo-hydrolase [Nocardioides daeguensis]